jgi:hypothetical protein
MDGGAEVNEKFMFICLTVYSLQTQTCLFVLGYIFSLKLNN